MPKRIQPILAAEVKSLGWKHSKTKNAQENLGALLDAIAKQIEAIQRGKLSVEKHIQTKKSLQQTLEELGQNIPSLLQLRSLINTPKAKEKAVQLAKKPKAQLLRELLKLSENEPKLRAKSTEFESAWLEIEGEYFLKTSLYHAELNRRA